MNNFYEKSLACPKCRNKLAVSLQKARCRHCRLNYQKIDDIWQLLYIPKNQTRSALETYDRMHREDFGGPSDGSYEILAAIARGNKTLDIACGEGLIEKLSPETVGLEFSLNALKKARKNGAKYLVLADAQNLPFLDNSFDITISAGSLEHFPNPQKAVSEMVRVSRIQVLTVHRELPIPFAENFHNIATKIFSVIHQPIEKPVNQKRLELMIKKSGAHIVFKGVWTLPLNYGRTIKRLPEFQNIPSCSFVISIKNQRE